MKLRLVITFLSWLSGSLLLQCGALPMTVAGGASGTDVSACVISGTVVDSLGKPVSNAAIILRRADFLAIDTGLVRKSANGKWVACDTISNAFGRYTFEAVDTGCYVIEVNFNDSLGRLHPCTVTTRSSRKDLELDTVYPLATITGHIEENGSGMAPVSVVQVYGMDRRVSPDSTGYFKLKVPGGRHHLRFSTSSGSSDSMEVQVNVGPRDERNLGSFPIERMKPSLSPCHDLACDFTAVRAILDSCGLFSVPVDSVVTVGGGRVTGLVLRNRNISGLPRQVERLEKLKKLDLSGNSMVNLHVSRGSLPELKTLILRGNQLPQLPFFITRRRSIESLDLSDNRLQYLPESIIELSPRVLLDLSGNKLCSLSTAVAAWADLYDADWRAKQECP